MIKIDSSAVDAALQKLSAKEVSDIIFKALKCGGKALKNNTTTIFKEKAPNASKLADGIRMKGHKNYTEVKVNILGDYRLKWFEKGTKQRHIESDKQITFYNGKSFIRLRRDNTSRGKMKVYNFFKQATENASPINEAIETSITRSLEKL